MMKRLKTLVMLLIIVVAANSQTKLTSLPDSFVGEWYAKDNPQGYKIHNRFIEIMYKPWNFKEFLKSDSTILVKTVDNKKNRKDISFKQIDDTTLAIKNGNQFIEYTKRKCPPHGECVTIQDIPKKLKKRWYSTDGKNNLVFDINDKNLVWNGITFIYESIMKFNDQTEQYRIIVTNGSTNKIFYLKYWNDNYLNIASEFEQQILYKNTIDTPNLMSISKSNCSEGLPDNIFGEWYNMTGMNEYNGIKLHKNFIEIGYKPWFYNDIKKVNDTYHIVIQNNNRQAYTMYISIVDNNQIKLGINTKNLTKYIKVTCPPVGKCITADKITQDVRKRWYSTDKKKHVTIEITNDKLIYNNKEYSYESIMHFDNGTEQYRIIAESTDNYEILYLKNWNDGYLVIASDKLPHTLFKNSKSLPNTNSPGYKTVQKILAEKWFSCDKKNSLILKPFKNSIRYNIKEYKLKSTNIKDKEYIATLTSDGKKINLRFNTYSENYISICEKDKPETLLKNKKSLQNSIAIAKENTPDKLFGNWYSTDGKNSIVARISSKFIEFKGNKKKFHSVSKEIDNYCLNYKKRRCLIKCKIIDDNYIEIKGKDGDYKLLKKSKTLKNLHTLKTYELPDILKADWLNTDNSGYWKFTINNNYFIYKNKFWNYSSITYKNEIYNFKVKNENKVLSFDIKAINSEFIKFRTAGGSFSKLTKNSIYAVYKPQNTPITDTTSTEVVINGYLPDYNKKLKSISFTVDELLIGDQKKYVFDVDSTGKFEAKLDLIHPQYVYFFCGNERPVLFLVPGDTLTVSITGNHSPKNVLVMGKYSDISMDFINNYRNIFNAYSDNYNIRSKKIREYSPAKYKMYRDTIRTFYRNHFNKLVSENTLSNGFRTLLKKHSEYSYYDDLMRYRWLRQYNGRNHIKRAKIDPEYFNFLDNINWDDKYATFTTSFDDLIHEYIMYTSESNFNSGYKIFVDAILKVVPDLKQTEIDSIKSASVEEIQESGSDISKLFGRIISKNQKIIQDEVTQVQKIKYYDKFLNIKNNRLKNIVVAREIHSLIDRNEIDLIKDKYPTLIEMINIPRYKEQVVKSYDNFIKRINSADPKELIINKTPKCSGDSLLNHIVEKHKNKVILIDIWATWCSPCRKGMQKVEKLKIDFKNKDVAFVYLCGRSQKNSWKGLIKTMKVTGDHYFLSNEQYDDICNRFKVTGIPHYVLINKKGEVEDGKLKWYFENDRLENILNNILKM